MSTFQTWNGQFEKCYLLYFMINLNWELNRNKNIIQNVLKNENRFYIKPKFYQKPHLFLSNSIFLNVLKNFIYFFLHPSIMGKFPISNTIFCIRTCIAVYISDIHKNMYYNKFVLFDTKFWIRVYWEVFFFF